MDIDKRAYSVSEFCQCFGIGRTTAYWEIKSGRLKVAKLGKRTLIPIDNANAWLRNLTAAATAA
jgi:excisionase family DNA binding protein